MAEPLAHEAELNSWTGSIPVLLLVYTSYYILDTYRAVLRLILRREATRRAVSSLPLPLLLLSQL